MTDIQVTKRKNPAEIVMNWFMEHIDTFVFLGISILYIIQGLFKVLKTGETLINIIGSILISGAVGLTIYTTLRRMGIKRGRNSDVFIASNELYGETKDRTKPFRYKAPAFCRLKNEQMLNDAKKEFIEENGLNYKLWLDGVYETEENRIKLGLEDYQIKVLEEINNIKIAPITTRELYSDLPKMSKKQQLLYGVWGKDDKAYSVMSGFTDAISMIFFAVLGGYYTLEPAINDKSLANALWNAMQLAVWIGFGLMKYNQSYSFMVNEYRQTHIIQKTEILNEFISIEESAPQRLDKYDYENQYIKEKENVGNE